MGRPASQKKETMEKYHCPSPVADQGPESARSFNLNLEGQPTVGNPNWKPPISPDSNNIGPFPEPPVGTGVNNWVIRAVAQCKRAGLTAEGAADKVKSCEPTLYRRLKPDEISRAINKVYNTNASNAQRVPGQRVVKWPHVDVELQRQVLESSPVKSVADLTHHSDAVPAEHTADAIVDMLFPGNPLICVGGSAWEFATDHRENLRGLDYATLIVPSPMKALEGMKADGSGLSAHTLDNTGERRFLVVEFDGILNQDVQASLIWHLGQYKPLVCVCFSGNKSLHAWFWVEQHPEADVMQFFRYAVTLGADFATWTKSQLCRLPGGYNNDRQCKQDVYYFKPGATTSLLLKTPGSFEWNLRCGADMWTKDQEEIRNLSAAHVVYGLVRQGDVGSVVGPAKTAKTWFSLGLALAVSQGSEFIGYPTRRQKTLYIDYELKEATLRKRMCMLAEKKPENFTYAALRGVDPLPTFDQIEELVVSGGYEFIVLDSLYRTGLLSEENSNDSTSRELTRLQAFAARTGVTILVVDHTAKGGGAERSAVDASRGASSKGGFFDFILVLRTFAKTGDSTANQVVLDPVVRDWPAPANLPVLSIKWEDASCKIELVGEAPADDPQLKCGQLLDIIAENENPLGVPDLEKCSEMPATTVRKLLVRLLGQKKIQCIPDPRHSQRKLYRIAPDKVAGAL